MVYSLNSIGWSFTPLIPTFSRLREKGLNFLSRKRERIEVRGEKVTRA
jgi:hypothetical protein